MMHYQVVTGKRFTRRRATSLKIRRELYIDSTSIHFVGNEIVYN